MILKDCGKHYGHASGHCRKCSHFAKQDRRGLQYNGTPWAAIFEPSPEMEYQDRIAALNRAGLSHLNLNP